MGEQLYRPCSNCNEGQCMDCTMRHVHDECYESPCPFCDGRGFVPVDPCEHGNYDRHEYSFDRTDCGGGKGHDDGEGGVFYCESFEWCDGAGLKETGE